MRLADFIWTNREQILVEWDRFAGTHMPASNTMDAKALRNHADEMLTAIAVDLGSHETPTERLEKSKGLAPPSDKPGESAATTHGAARAASGFNVLQMVAEYRALRASVFHLWMVESGEASTDLMDAVRFNEAIDQALAEGLAEFVERVETGKDMLIAMISHDLRTPLGAIYTSSLFVHDTGGLSEPHRTITSRIADIALQTTQLVGDLMDFSRSRLRGAIPLDRAEIDLAEVVHNAVDQILAANPEREARVATGKGQIGKWDAVRINQVLTNLVGNAFEHGSPQALVTVELTGNKEDVAITVHNFGVPIPADWLDGIFNPLKVGRPRVRDLNHGPTGNLGLKLYIAERIVNAHGGRLDVESSEAQGTTFTVHLPRSF